jgi:hypothetical protein
MEDATAGSGADKDGYDELDPVQHYFISTGGKKNKQASSRASSILRFKTSGRGDNGQNRLLPRCPD